jgi:hypothetical protein
MIPGVIEGWNTVLLGDGANVRDLKALRTEEGCFVTAWYPTPEEMRSLNQGSPVYFFVFGNSHPPASIGVRK